MATTFATVAFKNKTIDLLTGITGSPTALGYVNFYNGAQTTSPSDTPAGTLEFATYTYGPTLSGGMSFAGGGVSQLTTENQPGTPSGAATVSNITTARIYASSVPAIDVDVSVAGGGGGLIVDSVNSVAGTGTRIIAFSFKLPLNNGGTMSMNAALADRMVDLWTGRATDDPEMGKNTGGQCLFNVYSGSAPASADLPATGTLLLSTALGSTNIWATASGGSSALVSNPTSTAIATGTAGYARLVKSYGALTFIIQGSVGTSATDFVISDTALTSGVTSVSLNEATISI